MGHLDLIIEDQDNQLNLYDFGGNPAWLMLDQHQSWWRSFVTADVSQGDFRRIYDPRKVIDFNAFFEGVAVMDKNQTFRGLVDYHHLQLNNVYQAINRDPYLEHPFRLADNTTGSIDYWGPAVSAEYSRPVFGRKIFWGAAMDYQIETGLKDFFPQPRIIYRYLATSTGIAWRISERLAVGATLNYSQAQEFTECISPSSYDPRAIEVMKYRGEIVATRCPGDMKRFTKTSQFKGGFQSHYKLSPDLETAVSCYYNFQSLEATENPAQPVTDGTWKLKGYEIHCKSWFLLPDTPFRCGLSCDRIYFNDWAVHPDFDVRLGDDHLTENLVGLGFFYASGFLPITLGMEYHLSFAEKHKEDYISRMFAAGNVKGWNLKFGIEVGIGDNFKTRAGFIFQHNKIASTLLSFSEYLPDHNSHCVTYGLAYLFKSIEIETYGYYGQSRPLEKNNKVMREKPGAAFSIKFYRD